VSPQWTGATRLGSSARLPPAKIGEIEAGGSFGPDSGSDLCAFLIYIMHLLKIGNSRQMRTIRWYPDRIALIYIFYKCKCKCEDFR
jgi:hypothetical protein